MKFPYQKVPIIGQQSIALPLINILLGEEKISTVCLIDSGATYSFFHANLGEILGLNIKKGIEIVAGGVAGAGFIAYLHKAIPIELSGNECFINIAFSYELGTPYNLLGQYNFFQKFRVCFDLRKEEMDIIPKFD